MAYTIEATGLVKTFGSTRVLDGLDLCVEAGQVFSLLGPNGAGKTTTVRILATLLAPDAGTARVAGFDVVRDGAKVRVAIGAALQDAALDPFLTGREHFRLQGGLHGLDRRERERRGNELLERVGLSEAADRKVGGYSGGMKRRLDLASALVHEPEILFLDEPTAGLDPEATRDVLDLLASLAAEHGRTVLLCTHFLGEAGRLCQRMAVLHRGRLRAFGRPDDLAASLWRGVPVELDLGAPADERTLAALRAGRGVIDAHSTPAGARVDIEERAALPPLVASLVQMEVPVFGAVPRPPTVEEIYFAIQEGAE
jgi:ABC-2 type transport system ATP-binding protein